MRLTLQVCCVLFVAILAMTGCRGEEVVGVDPQGAANAIALQPAENTVPFHMSIRNTIQVVPPFPPPITNAIFEGSGKANPFGPFELFSTSQINVTVFPLEQLAQYVFTFRNGDELYATSAGTAIEDPPGTVVFSGKITFAGGTGRFSNASGSGTYAGSANLIASTGMFDIDGTISGFGGSGD